MQCRQKNEQSSRHERDFQKEVLKYLTEEVGGYWIKICASSFQREGEPDIVGCYRGTFYALELKNKDARASALQLHKLHKIKTNGGISMIIYDISQLKDLFTSGV